MKVMVLGVTGMLGSAMYRLLSKRANLVVYGTARNSNALQYFASSLTQRIVSGIDVNDYDSLARAIDAVNPDVIVNCIGVIKQVNGGDDPLLTIPVNSLLPHKLAAHCQNIGARLIHISTDCIYSGSMGNYVETDRPDPTDLYGLTKQLGEVNQPHTITIRTSLIGHELSRAKSLLNWFLAQEGFVNGFTRAIFSGLTTVEFATIVRDIILDRSDLHGTYHVAAEPISKFDLLKLTAKIYEKNIEVRASNDLVIDRSLNANRFNKATGYVAPNWPTLIQRMYEYGRAHDASGTLLSNREKAPDEAKKNNAQ